MASALTKKLANQDDSETPGLCFLERYETFHQIRTLQPAYKTAV